MTLYVLDTDTLTLAQRGHAEVSRRIDAIDSGQLVITVMSVEEQLSGWYTMLRRAREARSACAGLSAARGDRDEPCSVDDSPVQ